MNLTSESSKVSMEFTSAVQGADPVTVLTIGFAILTDNCIFSYLAVNSAVSLFIV